MPCFVAVRRSRPVPTNDGGIEPGIQETGMLTKIPRPPKGYATAHDA